MSTESAHGALRTEATALVDALALELKHHLPRGEAREAVDFLLSSLRAGAASGDWDRCQPAELLNCLEDILDAHLLFGKAPNG